MTVPSPEEFQAFLRSFLSRGDVEAYTKYLRALEIEPDMGFWAEAATNFDAAWVKYGPEFEKALQKLAKKEDRAEKIAKAKRIAEGVGAVASGGAAAAVPVVEGVARGAKKVGKGVAKGAKAVGSAAGGAVRDAGENVRDAGKFGADFVTEGGQPVYWVFFIITLALHIFLLRPGVISHVGYFILSYLVAMVFILGTFIFLQRHYPQDVRESLTVAVIALILYILPSFTQNYLSAQWFTVLLFVVTYIPAWPFFMATKISSHWFRVLFGLYKLALVVFALVFVASALLSSGNAVTGIQGTTVNLWDESKQFWTLLSDRAKQIMKGGKDSFTRATNPGEYYTGKVEDNEKEPLGVYITDLRPIDRTIQNESEVIVYGNVRADSFLEGDIVVEPSCHIDREGAPAASVDPPQLEIIPSTSGTFQCTFPPLGKRGTYTVKSAAAFPFQTWAYITYEFVDSERAKNLARQGLDLHDALDIDENPIGTYTGGPVSLGMGGTPQPLLVDPSRDNILPESTRLGITLDSGWHSGKIERVTKLELKVPIQFELYDCDRGEVAPSLDPLTDNLYKSYVFENPELNTATSYTSVTCKLKISDKEEAVNLVSEGDKAVRSFVAVAEYIYSVEEQTTVRIT